MTNTEALFSDVESKDKLISLLNNNLTGSGIVVSFKNVRKEGDKIIGEVNIHWEETVAGKRIVLIDQDIPFSIKDRQEIYSISIPLAFGVQIRVHVDAYYELPNKLCIEARAEWPGGSVGTNPTCTSF
jgi:hypothetical protein